MLATMPMTLTLQALGERGSLSEGGHGMVRSPRNLTVSASKHGAAKTNASRTTRVAGLTRDKTDEPPDKTRHPRPGYTKIEVTR
jgi:hypothetical protein